MLVVRHAVCLQLHSCCKQCKGGSICVHNRVRTICKDCKGGGICVHQRERRKCKGLPHVLFGCAHTHARTSVCVCVCVCVCVRARAEGARVSQARVVGVQWDLMEE